MKHRRSTLSYLRSRFDIERSPIGVAGFRMGGRLSFLSACARSDEVAACAPFYEGEVRVSSIAQKRSKVSFTSSSAG